MTFTAHADMSTPRIIEPLFYWTPSASGDEVVLTGEEAHHVTVQRLRIGDVIALFDGTGLVIRGTVKTIDRRAVHVYARERLQLARPQPRLEVYAAVPKGDRVSVLLDMATQLGMARFTPLQLQRSVAEPSEHARERWRRICVEACKQSRRVHIPEIMPPAALSQILPSLKTDRVPIIAAHPGGESHAPKNTTSGNERVAFFVGPEGGFSEAEIAELTTAGAQFVDLGDGILRIETAAVALLASALG